MLALAIQWGTRPNSGSLLGPLLLILGGACAGGILLRIEGNTVHDGKTSPLSAAMTELHLRPQSPAMVELPPKTSVMPLAIMGGSKGSTVRTVP